MQEEPVKVRHRVLKTALIVEMLAAETGFEDHRIAEVLRDAARRAEMKQAADYLQEVWAYLFARECSGENVPVIIDGA